MVSNRVVAIIQRRVNTFLTELGSIERQTGNKGRMGEPLNNSWETVTTDVPYRIITLTRSNSSEAAEVGATETLIERWRLICPAGTSIGVDYRFRTFDDRVFQVLDVDDRLTDEGFVSALIVRARDG